MEEKVCPSFLNFIEEVRSSMALPQRVTLFDSTLREGEETPGVTMSVENKVTIAKALEEVGVTELEIGYPTYIKAHADVVKAIKNEGLKLRVAGFARIYNPDFEEVKEEIDALAKTGVDHMSLVFGVSDYQLMIRNQTKGWLMDHTVKAVEYAKNYGLTIDYWPYDSVRQDQNYVKALVRQAAECGADRIRVSDPVCSTIPSAVKYHIQQVKSVVKVPVHYHTHNDVGLALANSCAAVEGGAELIDVTVNGMGERGGGHAGLEEAAVVLTHYYRVDTGIKLEKLYELSKLVQKETNFRMLPNKTIVGSNCFVHESDPHVQAFLRGYWKAFEPFQPEVVGQKRTLIFGSTTGRESVALKAEKMGAPITSEQTEEIMEKIRIQINKKGYASEEEVESFIRSA